LRNCLFYTFQEILREHEIYDIFPQSLVIVTAAKMLCNDNTITQIICSIIIFLIVGPDPAQLNSVNFIT